MSKLTPHNRYIIVKKAKEEEVTNSGIIIRVGDEEDDKPVWQGTIVESAVPEHAVGDVILFNRFVPIEFTFNDEEVLAITSDDIIATVCPT